MLATKPKSRKGRKGKVTDMPSEEFVSLAELEAVENAEVLEGFNPEADANATVPPVPKGDYLCIVYHREDDSTKQWKRSLTKKTSTSYLASQIVMEIAENAANPKELWGRKLFPD